VATLPYPCLAFVTDRRVCRQRTLEEVVGAAVEGGADMVQLREKDLPAGEVLSLALKLKEVINGRALLFVNDRVDVALACGADGVQLGERGLPVKAARSITGGRLLIGRSVHTLESAVEAEQHGADFACAGSVFPTRTHGFADAPGPAFIKGIASNLRIPVLAIGGVTSGNVASVMEAGAAGCAVITAISLADDPAEATRSLKAAMVAPGASGAHAAPPDRGTSR